MARRMFLLSFLSTALCQDTYVSSEKSIWSTQSDNCIPATPVVDAAIGYSPTVYTVSNLGIDLPDDEDVWVGYYQVERVFEYIGCVQFTTLFGDSRPSFVKIYGDPGHCFPGCKEDTIVGVSKTRCYCLGDEFNFIQIKEAGCVDLCNHPSVSCGQDYKPPRYMHLSIYKINNKVTASAIPRTESQNINTLMNCLKLEPHVPKTFYWDRCTLLHSAMCYSLVRVEQVRCANGINYCTWAGVANTCFAKGLLPTLYSNAMAVNKGNGSQLWTGLFKTNVVYKYNADIPADRRFDKKLKGYLRKATGTEVQLKFAEEDSNKRKLCLLDPNKKSTPISTSVHIDGSTLSTARQSDKTKKDNDEIKSPSSTSTSAAITTDNSPSNNTQSNTNSKDMGSPGVYIAIGASASFVLVAVIIGLIILFFKRRRKSSNQPCNHSDNSTPTEKLSGNENDGRDQALANTSLDRNNYFILEPHEKENENKDIMNMIEDENTEYDTTQVSRISERDQTENLYNQLENSKDTLYDQTITCDGNKTTILKDNMNENTYDTSTNAKKQFFSEGHTDNIYNKVSDIDGDEYSHIGGAIKQSKTDNLYGFQRTECTDKSLNDEHSTYNCIANGHDKNGQTDNTYSRVDAK